MKHATEPAVIDTDSFQLLAKIAMRESGLSLAAEKTTMIQSRLRKRLRATSMATFNDYARFVDSDKGTPERKHLISALTTNVSHFFREEHHYSILLNEVVQPSLAKLRSGNPLRIWSAGCSNGQEAYSAAVSLLEAIPEIADQDLRILGTDIDYDVVRFASLGEYTERFVGGLSKERLSTFFNVKNDGFETSYVAADTLRKLVRFRELNLHARWPMKRRFDAIFCRNVVIYFDKPTQEKLWPRFFEQLTENGRLFLGHSERIADPEKYGLEPAGPTTYKKRCIA